MVIFKIERPPFWTSFLPVSSIKGMSAAVLLRHCAQVPCSGQQNFVKNRAETGAWIAWIMAEIEPYSFKSMRDSSESEEDDVHERHGRRRGNTSWYVCECCANWEGHQEKERLCCIKEIEEAVNVNKISGE